MSEAHSAASGGNASGGSRSGGSRSGGRGRSARSAAGNLALMRPILTPEGVTITVQLASRGDRAVAFAIDAMVIIVAIIALIVVTVILAGVDVFESVFVSLLLLALFALRNFYFTYFEIRRAGQTPGKRVVGIKVIDRKGGPLRPDAVIARNLTREIEIFLPLSFMAGGGGLFSNDISQLAGLVWVGIFALMPLFNRDNLRVGDMVGGTWVVVAPVAQLLDDLTVTTPVNLPGGLTRRARAPRHHFTEEQLSVYGIYELQTLEHVLRRDDGPDTADLMAEVGQRIAAKIGWRGPGPGERAFLEDYYLALRRHLETRMLFGERRESKAAAGGNEKADGSAVRPD